MCRLAPNVQPKPESLAWTCCLSVKRWIIFACHHFGNDAWIHGNARTCTTWTWSPKCLRICKAANSTRSKIVILFDWWLIVGVVSTFTSVIVLEEWTLLRFCIYISLEKIWVNLPCCTAWMKAAAAGPATHSRLGPQITSKPSIPVKKQNILPITKYTIKKHSNLCFGER